MVLDRHAGRHGCRKHLLQIGEAHPYFLERRSIFFLQAGSDAFDHAFVFVGVTARQGRESSLMTGSAEIRESPETASVLAVLDTTNRWLEYVGK